MAGILGVGIATVDIINTVEGYPAEDSEVRAIAQYKCRGGNVTNTLVILSQLGHKSAWAGVMADDPDVKIITEDLESYNVDISGCHKLSDGKVPTSYIILNSQNGSRSIVHHRNLQEYSFVDFSRINHEQYDWLHFEGRAIEETARMLAYVKDKYPHIPVSVEIEKNRLGIERLFSHADLLLFSRIFALSRGFNNATDFLQTMHSNVAGKEMVCAWGEQGAYASDADGNLFENMAYKPEGIVDTIGAGDVFNAGYIHAKLCGLGMQESLGSACRLAGVKCGQHGMAGVGEKYLSMSKE